MPERRLVLLLIGQWSRAFVAVVWMVPVGSFQLQAIQVQGSADRLNCWFQRSIGRSLKSQFPKDTKCVWYLEAPADLQIEINFKNFDLGGSPLSGSSCDASRGWVNITEVREDRTWDPTDTNVLLGPTCGKQTAVSVKGSLGPYVKESSIWPWGHMRSNRVNWINKR